MYENMQKMILILKYTNVIIMMKIILADLNLQSVSAHMKHAEMHEITWSWNGKHIILLALIVELLNKKYLSMLSKLSFRNLVLSCYIGTGSGDLDSV